MIEARCRYRSPARYDDRILIETRPAMLRGSVLKFAYRILRKAPEGEEPTLLAEGETVHVVCDDQMNKTPLPEKYASALRTLMPGGISFHPRRVRHPRRVFVARVGYRAMLFPMEPKESLTIAPELQGILAELSSREPIFHRPEFGTTRTDFSG